MAGHSRVNSSTMLSSLRVRLSSVVSNWKSSAHRAFGAMRLMAPTDGTNAPHGLLALAIGDLQAFVPPKALDPLVVDPPARHDAAPSRLARQPQLGRCLEKGTQERPESLFVLGWRR